MGETDQIPTSQVVEMMNSSNFQQWSSHLSFLLLSEINFWFAKHDQPRDHVEGITKHCHVSKGIAGVSFNFPQCLELEKREGGVSSFSGFRYIDWRTAQWLSEYK